MEAAETDALRLMLNDTSEQRDSFQAHADTLTHEVVRLREQCDAYAKQLSQVERDHNAARSQWANKLEQAEHEFSDMLTREDLEAMRLQLVEQTEVPWRARVKALEGELAAAKEATGNQRREAEHARAAAEAAAHEHRALVRELEAKHETEAAELRARLDMSNESLRAAGDSSERGSTVERTRRLQREHAEATIRSQKLLEEVEELRQENDSLLAMRSQLLGAQGTLQGESRAATRLAEAEKATYERRLTHLQHELDASMAAQVGERECG